MVVPGVASAREHRFPVSRVLAMISGSSRVLFSFHPRAPNPSTRICR